MVIGAYGHIGSYLVPKLVKNNNEVIAVSRGKRQPYTQDSSWNKIQHISLDRVKKPSFATKIADLNADVVVDLINFELEDTQKITAALKNTKLSHYLFCSSIWAHGRARTLPVDPNDPAKEPLDDYGKNKFTSEQMLFQPQSLCREQISGPGWTIINPVGNTDLNVFQKIANDEKITLPNFGMETVHHVHADDVAQMFYKAILHRNQALGESFHAVAAESITLYGYAKACYRFFGQEAQIDFIAWPEWIKLVNNQELSEHSYYHSARSGSYSIENARELLNYEPKYTTLETVEQGIQSYLERGLITPKKL